MSTEAVGRSRQPRPRRVALYRLLACGLSMTLACALGELALRVGGFSRSYANPFSSFHERDPVLGWRGKPNFSARLHQRDYDVVVTHDEYGFRRRVERPGIAPAGYNVFVLGDSFVWGWGVGQEQVFTDRLEQLLPGAHVHNLGLCGGSTVQAQVIFTQRVRPQLCRGDSVVLAFFGNDFGDNVGRIQSDALYATVEAGAIRLVPPAGRFRPSELKNKLADTSYLFNLAAYCANRAAHGLADWKESRSSPGSAAGRKLRPGDSAPATEPLADASPEVQITKHFLGELQRACTERGATFLVAMIPYQVELGEADGRAAPAAPTPSTPERDALFGCAASLGLETIDLLPHFLQAKASGQVGRLTFAHDLHWNADGHALAATVIAPRVAAQVGPRLASAHEARD